MKKKHLLGLALTAIMSLSTLFACTPVAGLPSSNQSSGGDPSYATLTSATNGATLNLLSDEVYDFVSTYKINVETPHSTNYTDGTTIAKPTPVRLTWEDTESATHYTVQISLNSDMSGAKELPAVIQKFVDVENLFMGTKYYYQVYAHRTGGSVVKSKIFNFTTAHQPRVFDYATVKDDTTQEEYLDSNLRDIGGYYTEDGNYRVKQGIAYRSAEVRIFTEDSKKKLIDDLGIKTELAVHNEATSYLADYGFSEANGNYIYTAGPHYVEWSGIAFYGEQTQANLKKELLVFAEPANFPILFHCQLGRDRTGTLAFVLGALLGVSFEDLCLDYELSYLTQYGGYGWTGDNCAENKFHQFVVMYQYMQEGSCTNWSGSQLTNPYCNPSATLAENTASYLKGMLGMTDAQIAAIRANMLEEV